MKLVVAPREMFIKHLFVDTTLMGCVMKYRAPKMYDRYSSID